MQRTLGYLDEGGASGGQELGPCLCGCRKRRWLPFWRNGTRAQPGQAKIKAKMKKDKTFGKFCYSSNKFMPVLALLGKRDNRNGSALSLPVPHNQTPARLAVTLALTEAGRSVC